MVRRPAIVSTELPKSGRVMRRPQHQFHLRTQPWAITPFCIAPVIPNETLVSAVWQSRCVTLPIKNPLIGWWNEYYLFYVKHRDLIPILGQAEMEGMVLNPDWTPANIDDTVASTSWYHSGEVNKINWTKLCTQRIVDCYFRNEGEVAGDFMIGNYYAASASPQFTWADSLIRDIDSDQTIDGTTNPLELENVEEAYRMWQYQTMMQLTAMDYDDWLRAHGVSTPKLELHEPELLRYAKEWSYPTNTVDPSNGTPRSAVSWAVAERADKDRYFREPGFIIGLTVTRPKIYWSNQGSSVAHEMNRVFDFMPAVMRDDPYTSLKEFAADAGPLVDSGTEGYWIDMRDLYLYGDQLVNFALTETDAGLVALPTATLQKRYATEPQADALFVTAPTGQDGIRMDGVINFNIKGAQVDTTPGVSRGLVS